MADRSDKTTPCEVAPQPEDVGQTKDTSRPVNEGTSRPVGESAPQPVGEVAPQTVEAAQTINLERLSLLVGLGTVAITAFSLMTSFSMHLTRSLESGYPFFLAQISAADIVPMLPGAAALLLLDLPALLGINRLLVSSRRLDAAKHAKVIFVLAFVLPCSVLLPSGILLLLIAINANVAIVCSAIFFIAWVAMIILFFKQNKELSQTGDSIETKGYPCGDKFELMANSIYVGLSIVVAVFFVAVAQVMPFPAPLVEFFVVLGLAICAMVAPKYLRDVQWETSFSPQGNNNYELKHIADDQRETSFSPQGSKAYLPYFEGAIVALFASFALGFLIAQVPSDKTYVVAPEGAAGESASDAGSLVDATNEEMKAEYLILDTFANGNAVVLVDGKSEGTKAYKLVSLTDGCVISEG